MLTRDQINQLEIYTLSLMMQAPKDSSEMKELVEFMDQLSDRQKELKAIEKEKRAKVIQIAEIAGAVVWFGCALALSYECGKAKGSTIGFVNGYKKAADIIVDFAEKAFSGMSELPLESVISEEDSPC